MGKDRNIVHQYFRKEAGPLTLLVRVNPLQFTVMEITLSPDHEPQLRELEADDDIFDDLKADGFCEASPLEFNLYYSGLIS